MVNNWSDSKDLSGDKRYNEKCAIAGGTPPRFYMRPSGPLMLKNASIVTCHRAHCWTCL